MPNVPLQCPDWLTDQGKACWNHYRGLIAECTAIETVDEAVLAAFCEMYAEIQEATASIKQDGLFYKTANMRKLSPASRSRATATKEMRALAAKLGFSPADRGKAKGMKPSGEGQDPLQEFLDEGIEDGNETEPEKEAEG